MLPPGSTIVLATDAWRPQISGVVRTWESVLGVLETRGYQTEVLCPADFRRTWPLPRYPEIRLAPWPFAAVNRRLNALQPDAVHIATEGPIGIATRRWCVRHKVPFTTSYHTKLAEYAKAYAKLPLRVGYGLLKKFHGPASATLVPTPTIREELMARGFQDINVWTRGVDHETFRVYPQEEREDFGPGPVFLYAGRLAVEKTSMRFCSSISLAPKSWWAMVRIGKRWNENTPTWSLRDTGMALTSPAPTPVATALCSPASRTRLGW